MSSRSGRALVERAELLKRSRRARSFFVEGVRALDRARSRGWEVEAWLYAAGRERSGWAEAILSEAPAAAIGAIPPEALATLSDKEETSELVALVRMPDAELTRIPLPSDLLAVVADRPASPGNLGALLRTCDALGVHGLLVSGHACDPFDPRAVRASAGSLFSVPVALVPGPRELAAWLDTVRGRLGETAVLGSSAKGDQPVSILGSAPPTVLLLGNEQRGLSAALRELCDAVVRIPIQGDATSLDLTSAAAIPLHEMQRGRSARFSAEAT